MTSSVADITNHYAEFFLLILFLACSGMWLHAAKQPTNNTRKIVLWVLVCLGVGAQIETGMCPDGKLTIQNFHDYYHYYFAGKYFPELGYERLYICSSVAIEELGMPLGDELANENIRDLSNKKGMINFRKIDGKNICKKQFSPERWQSFLADTAIFLAKDSSKNTWTGIFSDLGNNPPPTWYALAVPMLNDIQLNTYSFSWINKIDFIILVAIIPIIIGFTLGNITAAGYLLLLFFNYLAPLNWIVGSFGRSFWIITLFLAYIFFIKSRIKTASVFFALSFIFGIFPLIFFVFTLIFQYIERKNKNELLQMIISFLATTLLLTSTSIVLFGIDAWESFFNLLGIRINVPASPAICFWKVISFLFLDIYALHVKSAHGLEVWLGQVSKFYSGHLVAITTYQIAIIFFMLSALKYRKQPSVTSLMMGFLTMFLLMKPLTYYYMYLPFLLVFYDTKIKNWNNDAIWLLALMMILELWSIPFLAIFDYHPDFNQITAQISVIILAYFLCYALFNFLHRKRT